MAHCAYYGQAGGDKVKPGKSPFWLHHSPGSGLSVNVGRTLIFRCGPTASLRFGPCAPTFKHFLGRVHAAAVEGDFYRLDQYLFNRTREEQPAESLACWRRRSTRTMAKCWPALTQFDSLQFVRRPQRNGLETTEIVMLSWGHEEDFVTAHLRPGRLMRGRHPHLRPCWVGDAAPRMQGPSCRRPMTRLPSLVSVRRWNNCTEESPYDTLVDETPSDAEAERLLGTRPSGRAADGGGGRDVLPLLVEAEPLLPAAPPPGR